MSEPLPVTIGIATRNRQALLQGTVRRLAEMAPGAAGLLVVDDASEPAAAVGEAGRLPFPVRVIRNEAPTGYIAARNRIARECGTPFVLSCDDDSYPVSGDLSAAVAHLERSPGLIALSFPFTEGPERRAMNPSASPSPYPVRQFIGCAHLIRVEYFLKLGGYWDWLVQQNEERELCYRALAGGWRVEHFPGLAFHHDYTPAGRNWGRHEYYTMRNEMAVELAYAPRLVGALKVFRNLLLACWWSFRSGRAGYARGYFAGLSGMREGRARGGERLSVGQYKGWSKLPWK